jgi:hypothetical protein
MSDVFATSEPVRLAAGTSAQWTRALASYPADDGWVLSYGFLRIPTGDLIHITAAADGSVHKIDVPPTDTADWLAGEYNGQGRVVKGAESHLVWRGRIVILPDLVNAGQIDTRSKARRILDFIDESFERAAKKETVAATIEGVALTFRNLRELQEARNYWAALVAAEDAELVGHSGRGIFAVFRTPR